MNPVIEAIKNRRSTRKYAPEMLSEEHLTAILDAGLWAPSAHNDQGWHLTVLRNKEMIEALNTDTKAALLSSPLDWARAMGQSPHFHVFYHAPVVIVVSGRNSALSPLADCCAAIQNMLIAAESLSIGSCWIGLCRNLFAKPDMLKKWAGLLKLPQGHTPQFCVTLGNKTGFPPKPPNRAENTVNYIN